MSLTHLAFVLSFLAIAVTASAQSPPKLAGYYTLMRAKVIDATYSARGMNPAGPFGADLNGNGNEDLVVFGIDGWRAGQCCGVPQPGRVFFGDGDGTFTAPAPTVFPMDTLQMVDARNVVFADLNGDGRLDMFVAGHGWDGDPLPGEQNRLYLSQPGGGWRDATASLPQLNDYTHSAAAGDLSGRGVLDIVVGNIPTFPKNTINPYVLLNDGAGQFTMTRADIPAGPGQVMDGKSHHFFTGTTLTDLNGDGLPDLILASADGHSALTHTTILWNRGGAFTGGDKTELPAPSAFGTGHIDLDVQPIDFNGDGLPDLVMVGSQGGAAVFYDGWFVQLLQNQGDGTFADVTASYLAASDASGGIPGVATGSAWPLRIRVLDYNGDGLPDFAVEYYAPTWGWSNQDLGLPGDLGVFGGHLPPSQPLIYLNDGKAHFSTLKVGDFVAPGYEQALGGGHLVRTRNGYSFITPHLSPGTNGDFRPGLHVTGLLATKPYRSPSVVNVVEYRHATFDHYFITPVVTDIALLDARVPPFQDWSRTGFTFNVYVNATAPAGSVAICRFFNDHFAPKSSHFYGPRGGSCDVTLMMFPDWKLEDDKFFNAMLSDMSGGCPAGTIPVYRLFNNGMGGAPNHRFVTSLSERQTMVNQGWKPEGNGIGVETCVPP